MPRFHATETCGRTGGDLKAICLEGSSQLTSTPGKINMLNLQNGGLEGVRPFQFGDFRLHVNVSGV